MFGRGRKILQIVASREFVASFLPSLASGSRQSLAG